MSIDGSHLSLSVVELKDLDNDALVFRVTMLLGALVFDEHENGWYFSNVKLLNATHEAYLRKQRQVVRPTLVVFMRDDPEYDLKVKGIERCKKPDWIVSVQISADKRLHFLARNRFQLDEIRRIDALIEQMAQVRGAGGNLQMMKETPVPACRVGVGRDGIDIEGSICVLPAGLISL